MTDPKLIVKRADGSLVFDTRKISYGLVKSGNMQEITNWGRRTFKGGNVDPAYGTNWTDTYDSASGTASTDAIHGFTVRNARSPIAFITGSDGGSLNTINRNPDGSCTFMYTGAGTNTKFYCFDLMADNIPGRPFLKTRKSDGTITFNSLQPPLNIYMSIMAPANNGTIPYSGAGIVAGGRVIYHARNRMGTFRFFGFVELESGVEYAAHLPWTRGGTVAVEDAFAGSSSYFQHSVVEGVFGRAGGVTFTFCEAGGTPYSMINPQAGYRFSGIVPEPRPVALIIRTRGLPFPYN